MNCEPADGEKEGKRKVVQLAARMAWERKGWPSRQPVPAGAAWLLQAVQEAALRRADQNDHH